MCFGLLAFVTTACIYPAALLGGVPELLAMSFAFSLPAVVDVAAQKLSTYRSNSIRRFLTGLLLGIGVVLACRLVTVVMFGSSKM